MKPKRKFMFQQFGRILLYTTLATIVFLSRAPVFADYIDYSAPPGYATSQQLGIIFSDLEAFRKACGRYPTTEEGLSALSNIPQKLTCRLHQGQSYIDKSVWITNKTDSYGQPIKYNSDGTTYRVQASHGYYVTEKSPARMLNGQLSTSFPKHGAHWDNPDPPKEKFEYGDGTP
jgi:Type II secretion system (T2SS), protein G